jgi:hypothetical protein
MNGYSFVQCRERWRGPGQQRRCRLYDIVAHKLPTSPSDQAWSSLRTTARDAHGQGCAPMRPGGCGHAPKRDSHHSFGRSVPPAGRGGALLSATPWTSQQRATRPPSATLRHATAAAGVSHNRRPWAGRAGRVNTGTRAAPHRNARCGLC